MGPEETPGGMYHSHCPTFSKISYRDHVSWHRQRGEKPPSWLCCRWRWHWQTSPSTWWWRWLQKGSGFSQCCLFRTWSSRSSPGAWPGGGSVCQGYRIQSWSSQQAQCPCTANSWKTFWWTRRLPHLGMACGSHATLSITLSSAVCALSWYKYFLFVIIIKVK